MFLFLRISMFRNNGEIRFFRCYAQIYTALDLFRLIFDHQSTLAYWD